MKRGPKPIQLSPLLLDKYARGELPTVQAVADEAGISHSTASRILREVDSSRPRKRGPRPIQLSPLLLDKYARGELPTVQAVADEAGISNSAAWQKLREAGVLRPYKGVSAENCRRHLENRHRDAEIRELRAAGWTMAKIASKVGISGERVRQILAGISRTCP